MKMKAQHIARLHDLINTAPKLATVEEYIKAGHTAKRYRWDLFWRIPDKQAREDLMQELYAYLNDDHIDTALRRVTDTQ
jgi:hypothetical protein